MENFNYGVYAENSDIQMEYVSVTRAMCGIWIIGDCMIGSDSVNIYNNNRGIYLDNADASLENIAVYNNSQDGIYARNSRVELYNVSSENNWFGIEASNSELSVLALLVKFLKVLRMVLFSNVFAALIPST